MSLPLSAQAPDMARNDAIRNLAPHAAALNSIQAPAPANYQVFRLNTSPQVYGGHRYDAVRLKIPAGQPCTLVLLFVDVGNIAEYEIIPLEAGAEPLRGNTRLIHPALAGHDHEDELAASNVTLPKPWDRFELHLLGFKPELLRPGGDYLFWFRFADKQPADVLMAATILKADADVSPEKLAQVFGLTAHTDE